MYHPVLPMLSLFCGLQVRSEITFREREREELRLLEKRREREREKAKGAAASHETRTDEEVTFRTRIGWSEMGR